jgi:mRNA N6-methyladenine demethylase
VKRKTEAMAGTKNHKRKRSKSFHDQLHGDNPGTSPSSIPQPKRDSNAKKNRNKKRNKSNGASTTITPWNNPSSSTSSTLLLSSSSASSSSETEDNNNQQHDDGPLPLAFPTNLPRPANDFLRNESPYRTSFMAAMETAYEGFVVDPVVPGYDTPETQQQLETTLDVSMKDYFRTDVTQPFGLGTKCAKTYVTRCLVGEPGTTYKYLGLRMFAHPWTTPPSNNNTPCHDIQRLSQTLSVRTRHHLTTLDQVRRRRSGAILTKGRSVFDICLINRMDDITASDTLKEEPSIGKDKTSVSWHADSSLEHYSTIAVYQLLVPHKNNKNATKEGKSKKRVADTDEKQDDTSEQATTTTSTADHQKHYEWSIALRVAHHSEGPNASRCRGGMDVESSIVTGTPPIACSLPSCSAYYLLDDFNHHHQHTVLYGAKRTTGASNSNNNNNNNLDTTPHSASDDILSPGIRYSCTFRLLRPNHNVTDILGRCKAVIGNFHKKGAKLWRSEQLLLTELETEWLRQFYIQGRGHFDILWVVRH